MKKIFLLLGMSGSGKTTISKALILRNSNMEHYSIGNKFREIATEDKALAKYVFNGKRVPLEMSKRVIKSIVENFKKDIILIDGYPRDKEQMEFFSELIAKNNLLLQNVFEVKIDNEIAKKRVLDRSRGKDDNVKVFESRLKDYTSQMKDIRLYFKDIVIEIEGNNETLEIVQLIENVIFREEVL